MTDYQIILVSDYSSTQGLPSYILKALIDVVGKDKVIFVGEENRTYSSDIFTRVKRKLDMYSGKISLLKKVRVIEKINSQKVNLIMFFNTSSLNANDIKFICELPYVFGIHYCSDHPLGMFSPNKEITIETVPYFGLIVTMAEQLKPVFYQMGAQWVERIPFAYCKYTHLQSTENIVFEKNNKVAYFGTWTKDIEQWVEPLLEFNLNIEGSHWNLSKNKQLRNIALEGTLKADANMAIEAGKAEVVVNFTRAPHGCFHTMKTFELAIAGATIVSNYSVEQVEFFPADIAYKYFNTKSEMLTQVKYLLENKNQAKEMGVQSKMMAMPHSYHNRMNYLLTLLRDKKIIA